MISYTIIPTHILGSGAQLSLTNPPRTRIVFLSFFNTYLLIWLCWVLVKAQGIFILKCRIFSCGMRTQLQHVGSISSSLTRD